MAGRLYPYEVAYGGPGLYAAPRTSSSADASLGDGLRYRGDYLAATGYVAGRSSLGGVDPVLGVKRSVEDPYSAILGSRTTHGKSEAMLTTNPFTKRFRYECTSNLPNYPQRPGEKDCAHYMLTRSCNFGDNCKFDHPLWVPVGGISDWKELPVIPSLEPPERPGEPDCPYFLKTNTCKFASNCKFNHPKVQLSNVVKGGSGSNDVSLLPERPNELPCAFYMKTGKCKYGAMCKFDHPKDIELPAQENATKGQNGSALVNEGASAAIPTPILPAMFYNSKGLPLRPDKADCSFYLKTGSCKYGANCRYNHPDIYSISTSAASSLGQTLPSSAATLHYGGVDNRASLLSYLNPHLTSTTLSLRPVLYPQRPDEIECSYYMKKGECKFFDKCKFHHPILPNPSVELAPPTQSVRLSLAGLPRREDAATCAFYMKTGTCKYGGNCKFDHPTPGEAIAKAAVENAASQPATDTYKDTAAVSDLIAG